MKKLTKTEQAIATLKAAHPINGGRGEAFRILKAEGLTGSGAVFNKAVEAYESAFGLSLDAATKAAAGGWIDDADDRAVIGWANKQAVAIAANKNGNRAAEVEDYTDLPVATAKQLAYLKNLATEKGVDLARSGLLDGDWVHKRDVSVAIDDLNARPDPLDSEVVAVAEQIRAEHKAAAAEEVGRKIAKRNKKRRPRPAPLPTGKAAAPAAQPAAAPVADFAVGDKVAHGDFGAGEIVKIDGFKISVKFRAGVKKVISTYLQKAD